MDKFRKYLLALQSHYSTLQKIMELGNDGKLSEESKIINALIDDIIHHFDLFVKWENQGESDDIHDQGGAL